VTEAEQFNYLLGGLAILLAVASILGNRAAYRNGVSDGAYNQWLPYVRKIIRADAKFPPPCNSHCVGKKIARIKEGASDDR
jgi:hypothetical protein